MPKTLSARLRRPLRSGASWSLMMLQVLWEGWEDVTGWLPPDHPFWGSV